MGQISKLICNSAAEFLILTTQAGEQNIEARYQDETILCTGNKGRLE